MGWIKDLFSGLGGGVLDGVNKIVDNCVTSDEERGELKIKLEKIISSRDAQLQASIRKELEAKERIIVAEMNQGDKWTKRARPMVVYAGLIMIAYIYCIVPTLKIVFKIEMPDITLPSEFWMSFSTVISVWSVGRSFEKFGIKNKATKIITGHK